VQIIPVVEIESILYHHPAVRAVAIVGMPDPRVGERAVAYMVVKPDASIDLPQVTTFLAEKKVARSYFPERVEILLEMPMTATGKIQKFVLREWARKFASTAAFAVPSEPTMKSRGSRARLPANTESAAS
jgi:cyclohexanecarboxylate-CoA ligase